MYERVNYVPLNTSLSSKEKEEYQIDDFIVGGSIYNLTEVFIQDKKLTITLLK